MSPPANCRGSLPMAIELSNLTRSLAPSSNSHPAQAQVVCMSVSNGGTRGSGSGRDLDGPERIDTYHNRLITQAELRTIVPYTPQHILRLEKRGQFPPRVHVGPNRVAWLLAEVEEWIAEKIADRDDPRR
ncbi:MAG: AlpA family phage regulatory protein [Hyphomicrobiaceae bacterium]|nr:AlpA family phage regulatory protein [Hyphomicrobiaceae bacterium]